MAVSRAATIQATLNSQDSIVGEREGGTAAAVGYYADSANGQAGVGGGAGNRENRNLIIGFILPVLSEPIVSATFSILIANSSSSGGSVAVDLYGLSTINPDGTGTTLFAEIGADGSQIFLMDAFASPGDTGTKTATVTDFIQSLYTGNTPNQTEVFFRINPDRGLSTSQGPRRVTFTTSSAQLEIVTVPEPSLGLLSVAGFGLLLVKRSRRKI
ncbi:MAG: hypothetical protein KF712_10790 [Akkermansiaceae bacterium]|nr:hypothetical protein [Akkermansiaceae bacterium]